MFSNNPHFLLGRWILERGGASADLQGEVGFCRSTRGFFTSCSSTQVSSSLSRSSSGRRRRIVDKSSPCAAFVVRKAPQHSFRPRTPRVWRAAHVHASPAQTIHPCTPPAPPRSVLPASHLPRACPSALGRGGCGVHTAPPSAPRRSTPLWPQLPENLGSDLG